MIITNRKGRSISAPTLPEALDSLAAGNLGKPAARDLTTWALSHAAAASGAKGGHVRSQAKTEAARANIRKRWAKAKAKRSPSME